MTHRRPPTRIDGPDRAGRLVRRWVWRRWHLLFEFAFHITPYLRNCTGTITGLRIADCGLRIADCETSHLRARGRRPRNREGERRYARRIPPPTIRNPQSAIRNRQSVPPDRGDGKRASIPRRMIGINDGLVAHFD